VPAAPLFNYRAPSESADEEVVSHNFASWKLDGWLRRLEALRRATARTGYVNDRDLVRSKDGIVIVQPE